MYSVSINPGWTDITLSGWFPIDGNLHGNFSITMGDGRASDMAYYLDKILSEPEPVVLSWADSCEVSNLDPFLHENDVFRIKFGGLTLDLLSRDEIIQLRDAINFNLEKFKADGTEWLEDYHSNQDYRASLFED